MKRKSIKEMKASGAKFSGFLADPAIMTEFRKEVKDRGMRLIDAIHDAIQMWMKGNENG